MSICSHAQARPNYYDLMNELAQCLLSEVCIATPVHSQPFARADLNAPISRSSTEDTRGCAMRRLRKLPLCSWQHGREFLSVRLLLWVRGR